MDKPTRSESNQAKQLTEYIFLALRLQEQSGGFSDTDIHRLLSWHTKNTIIRIRKKLQDKGVITLDINTKRPNNEKVYKIIDIEKAHEMLDDANIIELDKVESHSFTIGNQSFIKPFTNHENFIVFRKNKSYFIFPKKIYFDGICPFDQTHKLRKFKHGKKGILFQSHEFDRKCFKCGCNFIFDSKPNKFGICEVQKN